MNGRTRLTSVTALTVASLLLGGGALNALAEGHGGGDGNGDHSGGGQAQSEHQQQQKPVVFNQAKHDGESHVVQQASPAQTTATTPGQHSDQASHHEDEDGNSNVQSHENSNSNSQSHEDNKSNNGQSHEDNNNNVQHHEDNNDNKNVQRHDDDNEDLVTPPVRVTSEDRPGHDDAAENDDSATVPMASATGAAAVGDDSGD